MSLIAMPLSVWFTSRTRTHKYVSLYCGDFHIQRNTLHRHLPKIHRTTWKWRNYQSSITQYKFLRRIAYIQHPNIDHWAWSPCLVRGSSLWVGGILHPFLLNNNSFQKLTAWYSPLHRKVDWPTKYNMHVFSIAEPLPSSESDSCVRDVLFLLLHQSQL